MTVTVEYRCADGTPLPVTFATTEDAAVQWTLEREHSMQPRTPLSDALAALGEPGGLRAYEETDLVRPSAFRPGPAASGFAYYCSAPMPEADVAKLFEGCGRLVEEHGSALRVWHDLCLPRVKTACDTIRGGDHLPLAVLAGEQDYAQHMTMIPAYITGNDVRLMADLCRDLYGDEAEIVAHELTQGYESETLRADAELWRLGRALRASPPLLAALGAADPATAMAELRSSGPESGFFAALDHFLAQFGERAEGWDIGFPTWHEQGPGLWAQLAQMAGDGPRDPADALSEAAARRTALAERTRALLSDDTERGARFERRLERLVPYVAVREERAHWQLVACGVLRGAVRRRGARLAERGLIDHPDDVFYLLPDEIDSAASSLRDAVATRRADHQRWKRLLPPPTVGGEASAPDAAAGTGSDGVVTGVPGARGVATGPARVVRDLADAHRVEPGDVLVCVMTSPPWTPLFAIAAAVVVDTGDVTSHPAIAAREYGIPCVLATRTGTATIPDGATVTVDGVAGTVRLSA